MAPPSPFRRSVTGRVSVVAHRGLSAEAPENTMTAFRGALEAGCDLVEFDCHLAADDVVVVIHDETLDRTTNGTGYVRDRTAREIAALDAGSWFAPRFAGERVPTLEAFVAWASRTPLVLSLEIKQPAPASGRPPYVDIAERVLEILHGHGMERRTLLHSFDHPTIRRIRELSPAMATAISYGGGTFVDPLMLGRAADASGIHPWWSWVSPELCDAAHRAGMHVHGWGTGEPPDPATIEMLVRAGVDSIDAADPGAMREILAAI
jgi:glycerophosphoryl diester phosphodiesterase